MKNVQALELAERIAAMIREEPGQVDLLSIEQSLSRINQRLEKLEAASVGPISAHSTPSSTRPSEERFNIAESIADLAFGKIEANKTCDFEPHNKPCDHCSMCSVRGF